jgi:AcrR family transcriptional regulator
MLRAVADAVAEEGYAATTVASVLSRAGVSRETFYQQFRDKEDCFLVAFDASVEGLMRAIEAATDEGVSGGPPQPAGPRERLDRALREYLRLMTRDATLAGVFLVGAYGAGPAAIARRAAVFERFVQTVVSLADAEPADHFACEALVGAISSLVTTRVTTGRLAELPDLRGPILEVAARLLPVFS